MAVEIIRVTHKNRGVTKNVCQHLPHWERNNYVNIACIITMQSAKVVINKKLDPFLNCKIRTVPFGIR